MEESASKASSMMGRDGYVCIVGTAYSLFLYLLYHPVEVVENTIFLLGAAIQREVARQLPRYVFPQKFTLRGNRWTSAVIRRCGLSRFFVVGLVDRVILWGFNRLFVSGRTVYAQDHIVIGSRLLCKADYVLLEDAPGIFTGCLKSSYWREKNFRGWNAFKQHLLMGATYGKGLGRNEQCQNRIVTEKSDLESEVLRGKRPELVSLEKMWLEASEGKRNFILKVFGVDNKAIADMSGAETIIFTQPFNSDCGLSEEEVVTIYRPYVERYSKGGLILKNHPRDTIDYSRHFPGVTILKTKAPMQLLGLLCPPPKRMITVNSAAIETMPCNTEVIWIGAGIDERIKRFCAPVGAPRKFTNVIYPNGENWL